MSANKTPILEKHFGIKNQCFNRQEHLISAHGM